MSYLKSYVRFCVVQLSGVAANEDVPHNQLLLVSEQNPDTVHATIEVTKDGALKAAVTVHVNGTEHQQTVEHENWETIPELVVNAMPDEFFAEKILNATFSGKRADGSEMVPAFGDSLSGIITPGVKGKEPQMAKPATPAVTDFIEKASVEAVEFVRPSADSYSAQICMLVDMKPTWVNVEHYQDESGPYFYARTNDMDFLVPIGPSFEVRTTDPIEFVGAIAAFLTGKSNGAAEVTVQIHRRHGREILPILEGTSESGVFAEKVVADGM